MPFSFLPRMIFPHLTDVTAEALRARVAEASESASPMRASP